MQVMLILLNRMTAFLRFDCICLYNYVSKSDVICFLHFVLKLSGAYNFYWHMTYRIVGFNKLRPLGGKGFVN